MTQPAPPAPPARAPVPERPPGGPAAPAAPVTRLPLPWAALLMAVAAALAALALAWAGALWFGAQALWVAPAAAAVAVLAAVVPSAVLLVRLLRRIPGAAGLLGQSLNGPLGAPRPLFLELAQREWSRARRYGSGAALLVVDVDRFARLAEQRGSTACDAVLDTLIRQTAPTLRGADLITRFGDAQMAIFLAQSDALGALDVAERVRERAEQLEVAMPQPAEAPRLRITVSVGVAQLRPAHLNLQSLVDDAQDAVLAARQAGGNCVRAAPVEPSSPRPAGWRDDHRARPH